MTAGLLGGALWVFSSPRADKGLLQPLFGQAELKLIKKLLQLHRVSDKMRFGGSRPVEPYYKI